MSNITKTEAPTIEISVKCPHCGKDIVGNFCYMEVKDIIKYNKKTMEKTK